VPILQRRPSFAFLLALEKRAKQRNNYDIETGAPRWPPSYKTDISRFGLLSIPLCEGAGNLSVLNLLPASGLLIGFFCCVHLPALGLRLITTGFDFSSGCVAHALYGADIFFLVSPRTVADLDAKHFGTNGRRCGYQPYVLFSICRMARLLWTAKNLPKQITVLPS